MSQALFKKTSGDGRVAAYEIMVVNTAISNLIREGKTFQIPSAIQVGRKDGMILMDQAITDLVSKLEVNPQDVMPYMENPGLVETVLKNMPKAKLGSQANLKTGPSQSSQASRPLPSQIPTKGSPPASSVTSKVSESTPPSVVPTPLKGTLPPKAPPTPNFPPSLKSVSTPSSVSTPPLKFEPPKSEKPTDSEVSKNSLEDNFQRLLNEDENDELLSEMEIIGGDKKKTG